MFQTHRYLHPPGTPGCRASWAGIPSRYLHPPGTQGCRASRAQLPVEGRQVLCPDPLGSVRPAEARATETAARNTGTQVTTPGRGNGGEREKEGTPVLSQSSVKRRRIKLVQATSKARRSSPGPRCSRPLPQPRLAHTCPGTRHVPRPRRGATAPPSASPQNPPHAGTNNPAPQLPRSEPPLPPKQAASWCRPG